MLVSRQAQRQDVQREVRDMLFLRIIQKDQPTYEDDGTSEEDTRPKADCCKQQVADMPLALKARDTCDLSDSAYVSTSSNIRHKNHVALTAQGTLRIQAGPSKHVTVPTGHDYQTLRLPSFPVDTEPEPEWMVDISNYSLSDIDSEDDLQVVKLPRGTQSDEETSKLYSGFKVRNPRNGKMRTHYKCEMQGCGKTFTQICNVKRHLLIHLEIKEYKCSICKKLFS
jgi:hypothetical protein